MMRGWCRLFGHAALLLALAGCTRAIPGVLPPAERDAIAARLMQDISVLASDEFGGRKPGTIGEARTLAYLTARMQEAGVVSGTNDPGSAWRADVALVSISANGSRLSFSPDGRTLVLPAASAVAFTQRRRELVEAGPNTGVDVFFAGYDAASLDGERVAGAIIILLDRRGSAASQRDRLFEMNAGAVVTVVADQAEIARIKSVASEEKVRLLSDETNSALTAYVTRAAMEQALGVEAWNDMIARADGADFAARRLDVAVSIEATSQRREFVSHNLVGMIPGARPDTGALLLLAHWDHLGECGPPEAADRICNGAIDNASGVAVMLELARRLKAGPQVDRDIYLLATTAEESGLLGARSFIEAPPIPLDKFVAAFNFDNVAIASAGAPLGIVGRGRTPFEPVVLEHLAKSKRVLGNAEFAESFLQRQDGWVLLQQGVPAVLMSSAFASREILGPFLSREYHRPSDQGDRIELGGAIDDLLLHEAVIRHLADAARYQPAPEVVEAVP
jgi:hypothetical protein